MYRCDHQADGAFKSAIQSDAVAPKAGLLAMTVSLIAATLTNKTYHLITGTSSNV
jgi:hypothetical protein